LTFTFVVKILQVTGGCWCKNIAKVTFNYCISTSYIMQHENVRVCCIIV